MSTAPHMLVNRRPSEMTRQELVQACEDLLAVIQEIRRGQEVLVESLREQLLGPPMQEALKTMCEKCRRQQVEAIEGDFLRLLSQTNDRTAREEKQGRVYFVKSETTNLIKIGFTTNHGNRINSLRNMSPTSLTLLGSISGSFSTEKEIHTRFDGLRHHGEWFEADPVLLKFIESKTGQYRKVSHV